MKELIIRGYVEATLRDCNGEVIAHEEGPNTVVEMSNNILMDLIYPRLGSAGNAPGAAVRAAGANMTNNTAFPGGCRYIGPVTTDDTHTQNLSNVNQIGYISVGDNLGPDSAGQNNVNANNDVGTPEHQINMVDNEHNHVPANQAQQETYTRVVDSVTFPQKNQIKFTTTFSTAQGNINNGISEIGLWTVGENVDGNGFVNATTPTTTNGMRLFARKFLQNTITKSDDGTLDISYTLTFGAG